MNKVIFLTIMLFFILSCKCSKVEPLKVEPVKIEPKVDLGPILAYLIDFKPKVDYRRSNELTWQGVNPKMGYHRYDAVQTLPQAKATITYTTGSELSMDEKTMVIINPPKIKEDKSIDRAAVRSGNLKGKTNNELWLLTSAALLKLKNKDPKKESKIDLNVEEGKKLSVKVISGQASLITKNDKGKLEIKTIKENKEVKIEAPIKEINFGSETSENEWIEEEVKPEEKPKPIIEEKNEIPIDLIIETPQNNTETKDKSIDVSGTVTGRGKLKLVINGLETKIGIKGNFNTQIDLINGANQIVLQLIRPDGSSLFKRLIVIKKE